MSGTDVLIIGGGVMGCGIALRLRQAGAKVTVLERAIPGAEASSAAAGILAPQMEAEGPGPMFELCLKSRGMYPKFADELRELSGVDIQYLRSGVLHVGFTQAHVDRLEATVAWQQANGLRAQLLDADAVREAEPCVSPQALGAAHFPDDHQVDNRLLVRALTMAAAKVGALFQSGMVRGLLSEGDRVLGVDVDGAHLRADAVVIAAGSWTGLVHGARINPDAVRPARGQMLELQLRVPLFSRVLFGEKGYLVPRADGRVLAGSTMELGAGFEKQVTVKGLFGITAMAQELCPSLAEAPIISQWAGLRPYTEDHLPYLGEGPMEGLFLASGHFRNGILLAPITARVVAEAVLGQRTAVDLRPFRYDRPRP